MDAPPSTPSSHALALRGWIALGLAGALLVGALHAEFLVTARGHYDDLAVLRASAMLAHAGPAHPLVEALHHDLSMRERQLSHGRYRGYRFRYAAYRAYPLHNHLVVWLERLGPRSAFQSVALATGLLHLLAWLALLIVVRHRAGPAGPALLLATMCAPAAKLLATGGLHSVSLALPFATLENAFWIPYCRGAATTLMLACVLVLQRGPSEDGRALGGRSTAALALLAGAFLVHAPTALLLTALLGLFALGHWALADALSRLAARAGWTRLLLAANAVVVVGALAKLGLLVAGARGVGTIGWVYEDPARLGRWAAWLLATNGLALAWIHGRARTDCLATRRLGDRLAALLVAFGFVGLAAASLTHSDRLLEGLVRIVEESSFRVLAFPELLAWALGGVTLWAWLPARAPRMLAAAFTAVLLVQGGQLARVDLESPEARLALDPATLEPRITDQLARDALGTYRNEVLFYTALANELADDLRRRDRERPDGS